MPITQALTALNSSTATLINSATTTTTDAGETRFGYTTSKVTVQNVDGSATVYLGTSSVTSSAYGYKLLAGAALTLTDVGPEDNIYAISTGSSNVAVLRVLS
jgi:hypothetical protein